MSFSYIEFPILKYDFIERTYVYLSRVICHKNSALVTPSTINFACFSVKTLHTSKKYQNDLRMTTEQQYAAFSATVRFRILQPQPQLLPALPALALVLLPLHHSNPPHRPRKIVAKFKASKIVCSEGPERTL